MPTRRSRSPRTDTHPCVNLHAAGLDIECDEIWACVPDDRDAQPVQRFGTFTPDLMALADWLAACRVETVAMESTGVYWIPVYELLEARGFRVYLVNAHHLKHVPGRKSDVKDCQWIQYLHTCGLLNGSFRPEADMCALRAYLRHRATLLDYRAAHVQHMQKALQQMNVQLTQVLTDITGTTGLTIIRAIVAGERDPVQLSRFRDPRCASSTEDIAKALTGHYRPEHVFALKQALALFDSYTTQLHECDAEIAHHFQSMKPVWSDEPPPLDRAAVGPSSSKNAPSYDAHSFLYQLAGVDLLAIPGLQASTAQTILSEIGLDMDQWPNEKAFCAWLGLAPRHEISGGKVLRRHTLKTRNRAGQAFRLAAQAAGRSHSGESRTEHRLWDRRLWDLRRLASVERCRRRHRGRISGWRRTSPYRVCGRHDLDRRRNRAPDVDEQDHNARLTGYGRASHSVSGGRSEICTAGGIPLNRSREVGPE